MSKKLILQKIIFKKQTKLAKIGLSHINEVGMFCVCERNRERERVGDV